MKRINLQLFALKLNTDASIVDYLKSNGQDSSYGNRKKLAGQYGINNYTGTADQNKQLLEKLKKSGATSTTSKTATATGAGVSAAGAAQQTAQKANNNAVQAAGNAAMQAATTVLQNKTPEQEIATTGNAAAEVPEVAPVQQNAGFTPTAAPTFTPTQTQTPEFVQNAAPKYKGPTTQAQQATALDQRLPAETLAAINSQFQVSQAYQQAMDYTNGLLQQLNGGKTSYTDQISQLLEQYQNREKFSYDADSDPLFQQALSSAMRSGKTAMQDTMGQAAALTGGYGSSYATNAGQNAYNQYLQEAYDAMPEYYQLAMEAYNMEGDNLLSQLALLENADAREYDRLYNAYNANYNAAQNMYGQEYGAWQDRVNNAYNYAGMLNSDYWQQMEYDESVRQHEQNFQYQQYLDQLEQNRWQNEFEYQQHKDKISQDNYDREFAYQHYLDALQQNNWQNQFDYQQYLDSISQGNYEKEFEYQQSQDKQNQQNWQDEFDYQKQQDSVAQENYKDEFEYQKEQDKQAQSNYEKEFAYQQSQDKQAQSNYENEFEYQKQQDAISQGNWEKEYSQAVNEFNQSFAEDQRQFNESMTEDKRQFDESMAEDKRQFDESLSYDKDRTAQEQANYEREMALKESQAQAEANGEEYEYKTPTEKMFTAGLQAAIQGGENAVVAYCDTIGDYDGFAIVDYCQKKLTFTKTKDTINGLWGVDHNDVFQDGYGQTYTLKEIAELMGLSKERQKELTKLGEGETLDLFTAK